MSKCYKCIHKSVCIDDANYKYAENCNRYVGGNDEMRNYQRTKNNPYKLPHNLYMRILYLVRDYERIKSEREDIIHGSPEHDGLPASNLGNPTEAKGIKLAMLGGNCKAIEEAFNEVPKEYRKGVWNNICYQSPYPIDAGEATYKRWRSRFIYKIAEKLHEI